jgi:hypothetical protein
MSIQVKRKIETHDTVVISEKSGYYGTGDANPDSSVKGVVNNVEDPKYSGDHNVYVDWENGTHNVYRFSDLVISEPHKEFDKTKIYLPTDPKDIDDMFNILYSKGTGNYLKASATYYKEIESGKPIMHCSANKHRSFDDILWLAQGYFPEITVEEVFKELLLFNVTRSQIDNNAINKSFGFCSTMDRVRNILSTTSIDDMWKRAIESRQGASKYSWEELFKM